MATIAVRRGVTMQAMDGRRFSPERTDESRRSESAGQRFGRLIKAFRQRDLPDELITHQRIHDLGGPTRNVQSRIEAGQVHAISATTEAKYNRALMALGLPPDSATAAIYHGSTFDPIPGGDSTSGVPDDVESGVRALKKLNREHKSVADLVTELDRLGIELKQARSHADGYQLTFARSAIDQLLQTLQNATEMTRKSGHDDPPQL
ncbi:hypothetical protein IU459_03360 [Nocardia amamiensis]|uniref:Transcriptional regulator n=1 Tax=Nocardia amamiensis TaxID=404578 RepID=A0ABS0CPB9_9NOCA|nr:hypothetical protein [Nocardia amamiensis]MBF6296578.1 hypothetical protein [Nocardia amamiensis]